MYGLAWDQGHILHPDEHALLAAAWRIHLPDWPPSLSQLLDPEQSPLNPHFFSYGSLPIYLLKGVGSILSNFKESLAGFDLRLVGRGMAAVFDTGTVLLVYLLGRRLYNHRTGLLAAILVAFTVLSIQQAHFTTVDSMLTFLVALTVLFSAKVISKPTKPTMWAAVPIGLCLGLAIATKMSAVILLGVVATAYTLQCFEGQSDALAKVSFRAGRIKSGLAGLGIVILMAMITIAVTEPYIFIDWKGFVAETIWVRDAVVTRASDLPWTRQFINTTPYLYQIRHLSVWGMGLPLALAAWGGLLFTLATAIKRRRKSDLLLLSWILPFFLIVGAMEVKFIRYVLPLVPFLCLVAACLFSALYERVRGNWRPFIIGVIALVIASSVFYSFAHVSIYSKPRPVVQATQWANTNVDQEEIVAVEDWELLLYLGPYQVVRLRLYDEDSPEKMANIAEQLHDADYIIVFTNRVYGTIPRLPQRYPLTSKYHELLFSGELGFHLVYCATSYPSLFGITIVNDTFTRPKLPVPEGIETCSPSGIVINMGFAEETFTVFDHPKSMVFKKATNLSQEELLGLLTANQ
ncbi:MAG: glycosyltransferase family 39 protein [Dehalococcoidia bacterium]